MFRSLLFICTLLGPLVLMATHNRAGEIIVQYAGDCASGSNLVCATIITYTERGSDADRDSLPIDWGDGTIELIARTSEVNVNGQIQRNEYRFCHNYNGPGRFFISTEDPNRIGGILNVNPPNSIQIPFSIFTVYTLTNATFFGCNSSPILQQPPLDRACIGEIWTHNPGAFDPDGDSLSFEFTVPLVAQGVPVPNYFFPNEIGGAGSLTIDPSTGQIEWDSPNVAGEYNLAFLVISYRNGAPLDTMIRDMQILVEDCINDPPEIIKDVEELCVVAGELIEFEVVATAPLTDTDQLVRLQAAGGPFVTVAPTATFEPTNLTGFEEDPVSRTFRWQTTCDHISTQPYFVVFRAEDNFFADTAGLSTIQTVAIRVVAPPPQNVVAEEEPGVVTVTWELPYFCEDLVNPEFEGFTVWRREGSNNFAPDTCETGLAGRGYELLTPDAIREIDGPNYVYIDQEVERGRTYCYRILSQFARRSPVNGLILERIESIPSEEVCVQLPRDLPLLTRVDVLTTFPATGSIDVRWLKPDPLALDTTLNRPPYRYVLSRAEGLNPPDNAFQPVADFVANTFDEPIDSFFTDTGLDTENNPYSYLIELFVNNEPEAIEGSRTASSVRLSAAPTDRAVDLSWEANVPWTNFSYEVFRRLPGAADYELLTTVADPVLRDEGLENGQEYCYFISAAGTYGVDGIPSPLINRSQEVCVVPEDNVPPCPPELVVSSVCDRGVDCTDEDNRFNLLTWTLPIDICGDDDVMGYLVYFSPDSSSNAEQVGEIQDGELNMFEHMPVNGIVGCYFVTAFDRNGNESAPSNTVCVTNCPFYELPNAFTPNADTQNDLFRPRGFCFIERVEFQVFNRWGGLVFETADPELNWDGNDLKGSELASGTYYYTCRVFERRLDGVSESSEPLKGYIELVRGR